MINMNEEPESIRSDEFADEPRETGYVKWFNSQKGYGFIKRENNSDLFVHFSSINRNPQMLNENERVEFTVVPSEKGPEAREVVVLAEAL